MRMLALSYGRFAGVAMLIVRVIVGLIMVAHGWQKLMGGPANFGGLLAQLGVPLPTLMAWVVMLVELGRRRSAHRRAAVSAGRPAAHDRPRRCDPAREGQCWAYRSPGTGGWSGAGLGPDRRVLGDPLHGPWESVA